MKKSPLVLPLSVVLAVSSLFVIGQEPRRRVILPPDQMNPASQKGGTLDTNYKVTFSGKSDDKPLGELSTLTCSKDIYISGPLSSADTPTTFSVSGTLEEKDGWILFVYTIDFRVPVVTVSQAGPPGPPGPPQPVGYRSVQYQDHSSKGTLKMKPGKVYDLLKSGGNTYSIVVAPEVEK